MSLTRPARRAHIITERVPDHCDGRPVGGGCVELRRGSEAGACPQPRHLTPCSSQSQQVVYAGLGLVSDTQYSWVVQYTDLLGQVSPWSGSFFFTTGLLAASDWQGAQVPKPNIFSASVLIL